MKSDPMKFILYFSIFVSFFFLQSCQGWIPSSNLPAASTNRLNPHRSSLCMSIPNALDTTTSGFASIARLPFGTTVSSTSLIPETKNTIKLLYDMEGNNECRQVRERITELDLAVKTVVPSASNSRALNDEKYKYYVKQSVDDLPVMVVVDDESGEEKSLVGLQNIMTYLDGIYGTREAIVDDVDELKSKVAEFLISLGYYLPAILRLGRGDAVAGCALSSNTPRPEKQLILYSYEGNQFCRLVREVLTELDIPYELCSAGKGSDRRSQLAEITGGSTQCPYLMDPNTDMNMADSKDIIRYLYATYATFTPPNEILQQVSGVITPLLKPIFKTLAPLQAGSSREDKGSFDKEIEAAKAEIQNEINSDEIVIYTYSLSPFCTEAVEVLNNLDITFKEISLGAEWVPFLINEGGSQKRVALGEMTGQTSLPHVFVNGKSIGGLYEGLVPALEDGSFWKLMD
mmetsp:Transcript_6837/g.7448  ORF Transcript_6837/g.7448 Transcript_6837/m.7448 type:complete len:459 (+) Transcript_6837:62-1438(+)